MSYIIHPHNGGRRGQLGGKAGALADLGQTGLPIPAWIAVSPEAFYASLSLPERGRLTAATAGAAIPPLLESLVLSPTVTNELEQALSDLCPNDELVAVRSSALDEDGSQHSLAGQLDSFLGVPPRDVAEKVVAVWRSAFSERVLAYRRERGLRLLLEPPAVLIQRMVRADVSGVAFSSDPVSARQGVAVVAAVRGLATTLVSGEANAATYHIDRSGYIMWPNGNSGREEGGQAGRALEAQASQPVLTASQVRAVAQLARRAARFFGRPQDIEWAIKDDQLYLLQSRPITTLTGRADPDGVLNVWDNSNIAESYPGVTTPLTFSFTRRAYEEVYRQFCRLMGVPAETIAAHHHTFRCMLGFIRGRIYYNLLNWYQVLALLPGYTVNRRFMEQMMGVKESLSETKLNDPVPPTKSAQWRDRVQLLRLIFGLVVNYFILPRRIDNFYQRLNRALGTKPPELDHLRPDELVAYYRHLERQLLTRWDAPLINDFLAMIFFGLLRKLTERWCNDRNGSLQNDLLSGMGGLISTEPVARLMEMARTAAQDPELLTILRAGNLRQMLGHIAQVPEFDRLYQAYLKKFGDRCLEELKLESPTLHDEPLILLRSVGQLACQPDSAGDKENVPAEDLCRRAEQRVRDFLGHRPLRRMMFNWVLKNARHRVRDRENLRFERMRVFGRVRLIFLELGRRFYALDLLDEPQDIFYLEVEEVLGFVEGTTTTVNLKGLVALRQPEAEGYQTLVPPADRFETRGIVHQGNSYQSKQTITSVNGDQRQGIGCCPGLVRGRVRVVTDPKNAYLQPGEVLVAERTDPGWILLFPAAAGLLVEHGSLLSHVAIVARELGLPAIVSLEGVTGWLKDGDWVEFDGSSGLVAKNNNLEQ